MQWFLIVLLLFLAACGTNDLNSRTNQIALVNTNLTPAYNQEPYSEELRITGGQRAYTLRIAKGRLPEGITLQGSRLVGMPKLALKASEQRLYEFTLEITDSNNTNKFQELKLEVRNLPSPTLEWTLPPTQVREQVRLPIILKIPKNVRSMRVALPLPIGASLLRLEPSAGRPLLLSRLEGSTLRIDAALSEAIPSIRPATVFYVVLALQKPLKLGGKIGFELRAKNTLLSKAALELPKAPTQGAK
ncbi:MAG: putative Ig domain-containing protein [Deinococcales bacterium]